MSRVLAFILAVSLCLWGIGYVYSGVSALTDQVSFSENVRFGDPSAMDGRTARFSLICGDYLMWNFDYRFGQEDTWTTDFLLSQEKIKDQDLERDECFYIYQHSGFHMSRSGGNMILSNSPYADMVRTVYSMTPTGDYFSMNLKLKDFVEYHSFQYDLHYSSELYVADEAWDLMYEIATDQIGPPSYCHDGLMDLFRFPVQEDQIITISTGVDTQGGLVEIGYNDESISQISLPNAVTDQGMWCVPMYIAGEENPRIIPCPHKLGSGLYFIPWREVKDGRVYESNRQSMTLDTDNAVNVHPLPQDAVIFDLAPDETGEYLWMLSLENGKIVLTRLSMAENKTTARLELMDFVMKSAYDRPGWCRNGDLMVIRDESRIALISLGDTPEVAFIAPLGEAAGGFHYFTQPTGAMVYENGILYLADFPYYNDILTVMAFDETGPLYWGEYTPSLITQGGDNGSPMVMPYYGKTGLT